MALHLHWAKAPGDSWYDLLAVNPNDPNLDGMEGVYIIWYDDLHPVAVLVGVGIIKYRLNAHQLDWRLLTYGYGRRGLNVTWAQVPEDCRYGVERYLVENLLPKDCTTFRSVQPVEVNLPWTTSLEGHMQAEGQSS